MNSLNLVFMRVNSIRSKIRVLKTQKKNMNGVSVCLDKNLKNTYGILNKNDITRIYDNEINNIAECNLLHDIINPPKCNKN